MSERWRRELGKIDRLEPPAQALDDARSLPPPAPRGPSGRSRILAGVVAFALFGAAVALITGSFRDNSTVSDPTASAIATPAPGTYTDPLGWTIDVPEDWETVVFPEEGDHLGAAFVSGTPVQNGDDPFATLPPSDGLLLKIWHDAADHSTGEDSSFPLSASDLEYGEVWTLRFRGDGRLFHLMVIRPAGWKDVPPDVTALIDRMIGSISLARLTPSTAGLTASCGGATFDQLPPDTSMFTRFTSFDELDLSRLGYEGAFFLREFVPSYEWFVTQEGDSWRQLFGQPTKAAADPPYASMRIEMRDGVWTPISWGQCRIELDAEGWGNARFVIDPKTPPDPAADRISVLATEMACAGGQAPGDRDVRAVIVDENERTVSIVILVEPTTGSMDCQGNPAFPFEVELGSPLGDREILDASVYPPQPKWP